MGNKKKKIEWAYSAKYYHQLRYWHQMERAFRLVPTKNYAQRKKWEGPMELNPSVDYVRIECGNSRTIFPSINLVNFNELRTLFRFWLYTTFTILYWISLDFFFLLNISILIFETWKIIKKNLFLFRRILNIINALYAV